MKRLDTHAAPDAVAPVRRRAARSAVALTVLGLLAAGRVPAQHPSDPMFDESDLRTIKVTMAVADWQTLVRNPDLDTVYPCTFDWHGQRLDGVGVRAKGQSSRIPGTKPALRFRFDHYRSGRNFLQLTRLDVQAMKLDASMMRERLVYNLFRRRGVLAPRSMHVRVEVNGAYAGVFLILDQLDQAEVLRRMFPDHRGNLYKCNQSHGDATLWRGRDPSAYIDQMYQWERKQTTSPNDLIGLLDLINNTTDAQFRAGLQGALDVDLLLEHCALNQIVANEDWLFSDIAVWSSPVQRGSPWSKNFYWYFNPTDSRASVLVWDVDATMSYFWTGDWARRSAFLGFDRSMLSRRVMADAGWRAAYVAKVLDVLDEQFEPVAIVEEIDRIYAQIRAAVEQDTWKPPSNLDFHTEVARLRHDTAARAAALRVELGCPATTFTSYGNGCPGTRGVPRHDGSGLAALTRAFKWWLRGAREDSGAVLLVGVDRADVDLGPIGVPGCKLLVDRSLSWPVRTSAAGSAAVRMRVPDDVTLVGAGLFTQFFVLDTGAPNALGLAPTAGLETRVARCR